MSEKEFGEVVSLAGKRHQKEMAEIGELDAGLLMVYVIDFYFSGEQGQEKLMRALEKSIPKQQDREDILEFLNDLLSYELGEEDDELLPKEAENLDEKFGLLNILLSAIGKTKEQIDEKIKEDLVRGKEKIKSLLKSFG